MKTATLDRAIEQHAATSVAAMADSDAATKTSVSKTAVLVGLCFLTATFTFAIGNALLRSYFSTRPRTTPPSSPGCSSSAAAASPSLPTVWRCGESLRRMHRFARGPISS